jgi:hypothetical protein
LWLSLLKIAVDGFRRVDFFAGQEEQASAAATVATPECKIANATTRGGRLASKK